MKLSRGRKTVGSYGSINTFGDLLEHSIRERNLPVGSYGSINNFGDLLERFIRERNLWICGESGIIPSHCQRYLPVLHLLKYYYMKRISSLYASFEGEQNDDR